MARVHRRGMDHPSDARADVHKLAELIRDVRVAMLLTSTGPDGADAHARPMFTHGVDPDRFDGTLWFLTSSGSEKVHEIGSDRRVVLTYADPGASRYVAVYGTADVVRDPAKARELWNVHAQGWWPGGPDDPAVALVRVRVERGEYWDGPSAARYALRLVRAVASGEGVRAGGDHGVVEL